MIYADIHEQQQKAQPPPPKKAPVLKIEKHARSTLRSDVYTWGEIPKRIL